MNCCTEFHPDRSRNTEVTGSEWIFMKLTLDWQGCVKTLVLNFVKIWSAVQSPTPGRAARAVPTQHPHVYFVKNVQQQEVQHYTIQPDVRSHGLTITVSRHVTPSLPVAWNKNKKLNIHRPSHTPSHATTFAPN